MHLSCVAEDPFPETRKLGGHGAMGSQAPGHCLLCSWGEVGSTTLECFSRQKVTVVIWPPAAVPCFVELRHHRMESNLPLRRH